MAIILDFNLTYQATIITEIITLFDPSPPFQYQRNSDFSYSIIDDADLNRDNTQALAGFEATDLSTPGSAIRNLPANSYWLKIPSQVYGTPTNLDNYSVLQINTAIAKIEPGFSRLRVTYSYLDSNNNFQNISEYFDVPFYEGFNTTAKELNNIVDYVQGSQSFLQKELDIVYSQTSFALSRNFWRGIMVSGELTYTPATIGLQSGPLIRSLFSHSFNSDLISKSVLTLSANGLNFNAINSPAQSFYVEQAYNPGGGPQPTYYATVQNSNICNAQVSGNTITVTPAATGITFIDVTDGTNNGTVQVSVGYTQIGPVVILPSVMNFASPTANSQTAIVQDANYLGDYVISYLSGYSPNVATWSFANDVLTISPLNPGLTYIEVQDSYGNYSAIQVNVSSGGSTAPIISSLGTQYGGPGSYIPVYGLNFNINTSSFSIAGINAPIVQFYNSTFVDILVPYNCPSGYQTLSVTDGIDTPNSTTLLVLGAPYVSSANPTYGYIGDTVFIYGGNFGPTQQLQGFTQSSNVIIGGVSCIISLWSDEEIQALVPQGTANGPTQLTVTTPYGTSPAIAFTITDPSSLVILPAAIAVADGTNYKFTALYTSPTLVQTDVSANSTWSVNNVVGGDGTYGIINSDGLYTAPTISPPVSYFNIQASYVYNQFNDVLTAQAGIVPANAPVLVISPTNPVLQPGQQLQFKVYFSDATLEIYGEDVTNNSAVVYEVNNTVGGNVLEGFINTTGLYTAPNNLSQSTNFNITANYTISGATYTALASATVLPVAQNYCSLSVTSQINIYLGDGRFGYIPIGTQAIAYPNQYVFVQFEENLDGSTYLPITTYAPVQELSILTKDALDPDIGSAIYNTANSTLNSDGTISTLRTVVLGIVDPTDGLFHTSWDIANPLITSVAGSGNFSLHNPMLDKITTASFGGSTNLLEYINDLSGGAQTQLDNLNSRTNILLTGNCAYDQKSNTFEVLDNIHVLGTGKNKRYGILGTIKTQKLILQQNEYLYIDKYNTLKTGKFSDIFTGNQNPESIIVGAVLDKFYTNWPLLKTIEVDVSNVKELGQISCLEVGPLIVQWGITDDLFTINKKEMVTFSVELPKSFVKSYTPLVQPYENEGGLPEVKVNNINLNNFEVQIYNTGNIKIQTKLSWITLGV